MASIRKHLYEATQSLAHSCLDYDPPLSDTLTTPWQLEAELLMSYLLAIPRSKLHFSQDVTTISLEQEKLYKQYIKRRQQGEPLAYITQTCGFFRETLKVNNATLIPRPETEGLVELAITLCSKPMKILDLGTGSGCIAIALARWFSEAYVEAWDISADALKVAQHNLDSYGLKKRVTLRKRCMLAEDSWKDYPQHNFDLIITNPPYVDMQQERHLLSQETYLFEPKMALDGGKDGLSYYYILLKHFAGGYVTNQDRTHTAHQNSSLIAEIAPHQAKPLVKYCTELGLLSKVYQDLSKKDRYLAIHHPLSSS
ncbi:MAG: peptide chain release factor N(5)-glutamine methyltransferase [Proteobacteria bacterium]|nr:peptide chain release factor N(5)-glutamine methyltransferase [Pseudomonadota bacterium]